MPNTQFAVSGHVYASDESTEITSGTIYAYNTSQSNESISETIASGEYTINLANFTTQWVAGNKIRIVAFSDDKRVGILKFTIGAATSEYEHDIYVEVPSEIYNNQFGEEITIQSVSVTVDSYGQSTTATTDYLIDNAVVSIMTFDSEEVKAGILQVGDLLVFIAANDANRIYAKINNRIVYDGSTYKIVNATKEKGIHGGSKWSHYEVSARRI